LIQVVPCAVGALLAVAAIFQYPIAIFVLNRGLHLGYELVVNSNIAVGRASNHQFLFTVLANNNVWTFKVVWREDFELQLVWNVALVGTALRLVLVVDQVGYHVGLTDVNEETVSDYY